MKKIIFIIIVIALACAYFFTTSKEEVSFKTISPSIGDINISVEALGDVYANEIVSVGAQASGEILELNVNVGDEVKVGDVIAQLDKEKQENNLNIELAKQTSLKALKQQKELSLNIYHTQYQNQEKLYKKGATSYDNMMKAKNDYFLAKYELAQVQSQIEQNKVSVENYKKELAYTTITAPISGKVISLVASKGQTINSSQNSPTIVKLADTSKLEVKLFISQNDVNKLKPGMKISFYTLADDKKPKTATLDSIDIADTVTVDNVSKGAIYYYARFYINNREDDIKVGMSVVANIQIQSIKNTLLLPTINIKQENEKYYVEVLKDNVPTKTYIKIGKSDDFNTQILEGISKDDKIVVNTSNSSSKMINRFKR